MLRDLDDLHYSSKGLGHLEAAAQAQAGGIILMSHLGNWEIASIFCGVTAIGFSCMSASRLKNRWSA